MDQPEDSIFEHAVRLALWRAKQGDDIGAIALDAARQGYALAVAAMRERAGSPLAGTWDDATPVVDVFADDITEVGHKRPSQRPTAPPPKTATLPSFRSTAPPPPPPPPRPHKPKR